jgi:hypothetical protein
MKLGIAIIGAILYVTIVKQLEMLCPGTFGQKKTRLQFLKSLAVLGPILIFIEFNLLGRSY